jgi:tetratricopeptide (TPR) repeat protein
MESLLTAAARALAAGDAIGALGRIALREDPPALALRGIAMARLGEYARARDLLRRAGRAFGARGALERARCVVAEAEVALAMRDLDASPRALAAAAATLEARGDRANALWARVIAARRLLLLGRLDDAAAALPRVSAADSPSLIALAALISAELSMRSLRVGAARETLARARDAAERARVPALAAEVANAHAMLARPAARRRVADAEHALSLDEVAELVASGALVVDACRRGVRAGAVWVPLARRPVLFRLARALAAAWPCDVARQGLIADAFRTRRPDDTHRARLRVEIGRLRALVAGVAQVEATGRGFALRPRKPCEVVVLEPPICGDDAALVALLSDGAAWSTSSLALALDASQRTVQRALVALAAAGRVRSIGRARSRRWLSPSLTGFTTILLLPAALPLP